jgi:hypothetical protein
MVSAFEKASGKVCAMFSFVTRFYIFCDKSFLLHGASFLFLQKIPLKFADHRPGDIDEVYASTEKAEIELQWK